MSPGTGRVLLVDLVVLRRPRRRRLVRGVVVRHEQTSTAAHFEIVVLHGTVVRGHGVSLGGDGGDDPGGGKQARAVGRLDRDGLDDGLRIQRRPEQRRDVTVRSGDVEAVLGHGEGPGHLATVDASRRETDDADGTRGGGGVGGHALVVVDEFARVQLVRRRVARLPRPPQVRVRPRSHRVRARLVHVTPVGAAPRADVVHAGPHRRAVIQLPRRAAGAVVGGEEARVVVQRSLVEREARVAAGAFAAHLGLPLAHLVLRILLEERGGGDGVDVGDVAREITPVQRRAAGRRVGPRGNRRGARRVHVAPLLAAPRARIVHGGPPVGRNEEDEGTGYGQSAAFESESFGGSGRRDEGARGRRRRTSRCSSPSPTPCTIGRRLWGRGFGCCRRCRRRGSRCCCRCTGTRTGTRRWVGCTRWWPSRGRARGRIPAHPRTRHPRSTTNRSTSRRWRRRRATARCSRSGPKTRTSCRNPRGRG